MPTLIPGSMHYNMSLKHGRVLTYVAREGIHVDESGPGVDSLPQVKYPVVPEVSGQDHLLVVVEKGGQKGRNGRLLNAICIQPIKLHGNQVNNNGHDIKLMTIWNILEKTSCTIHTLEYCRSGIFHR